jgi:hypothetical protein
MRRRIGLILWLTATAAIVPAACHNGDEGPEVLPRINSLAPRSGGPAATEPATMPAASMARVTRLDFAPDADMEAAWATTSRQGLAARQVAAWKRNGLRVGVLDAAQVKAFLAALPPSAGSQSRQIVSFGEPVPLAYTAPLSSPWKIKLSLGADLEQEESLAGGNLQFLCRFAPDGDGGHVDIVPQHHRIKISLVPRSDPEKILDGRLFEQLKLHAKLGPDQLLVIGVQSEKLEPLPPMPVLIPLTQPAAVPAPPTPRPGAGNAATQPAPGGHSDEVKPAFIIPQDRLGAGLLNGTRFNRPVQMVLIISVAPMK